MENPYLRILSLADLLPSEPKIPAATRYAIEPLSSQSPAHKDDVDTLSLWPVAMIPVDVPLARRATAEAVRRFDSRIAHVPGSTTALVASADPDLIAQFDARVGRMFVLLDETLADFGAIDDVRQALHQLAGTAAFFGMAELGTMARQFDTQLGDPACATPAFLADARMALHRAAGRAR